MLVMSLRDSSPRRTVRSKRRSPSYTVPAEAPAKAVPTTMLTSSTWRPYCAILG